MKRNQDIGIMLIGSPETHLLERRVLNAALFGSAVITSLLLVNSMIIGFSSLLIFSLGSFTAAFWFLYFIGKALKERSWLPWVYLLFNQFIVVVDWVYLGGFSGAGLLVLLVLAGLMPLFLKQNQIRLGIGLNILTLWLVIIGFMNSPKQILRHAPTEARVWERLSEVVILSVGVCVVSVLVIRAYRKERERVDELNEDLTQKNSDLVKALNEVKTLQGMIPICSNCKKIRNDTGYYESVEEYIEKRTDADFSHTTCPECTENLYGHEEWYQKMLQKQKEKRDSNS